MIFVTGGSGFIGRHVVASLLREKYPVRIFDSVAPRLSEHIPLWQKGDIRDGAALKQAVVDAKPTAVIHLAAYADVNATDWNAFSSIWSGTRNMLDAIDACPSVERFINTSTQLVVRAASTVDPFAAFDPYTRYGEAKAYAEREINARDPKVLWCHVRPSNIWGPYHPNYAQAIFRYIKLGVYLHPDVPFPVPRTYGYVENCADQFVSLLKQNKESIHRKVFYSGDEAIDWVEWLDAFSQELRGRPVPRVPYGLLKVGAAIGDFALKFNVRLPLESQRLMRMTTPYAVPVQSMLELAGPPAVSFGESVKRTVAWLRRDYPDRF